MTHPVKRRGRPRKNLKSREDTRQLLLRSGLELMTEQGYVSTGLDKILKKAEVPKGSFYYYYDSKDAFGLAVMRSYGDYFLNKLNKSLRLMDLTPLERIGHFVESAKAGMQRYDFKRGCLVGNLAQEVTALPDEFRSELNQILLSWESLLSDCLDQAKLSNEVNSSMNSRQMAHFFWIGWEGAVMRARLLQSNEPLSEFYLGFLHLIKS